LYSSARSLFDSSTLGYVLNKNHCSGNIYINALSHKFLTAARVQTVPNTVSHEHIHILQHRARNPLDVDERLLQMYKDMPTAKFNAYGRGAEIQTRIHTLLAKVYQTEHTIPQNKKELWSLLIAHGLIPPFSIFSQITKDAGTQI